MVNMSDIVVVEATQHMDYGIGLADVCQKLVAKTLATTCTLHQSCNIYNFNSCGHHLSGMYQLGKLVESLIGNGDYAHVRFDCAEREICRLCLSIRQAVKQR